MTSVRFGGGKYGKIRIANLFNELPIENWLGEFYILPLHVLWVEQRSMSGYKTSLVSLREDNSLDKLSILKYTSLSNLHNKPLLFKIKFRGLKTCVASQEVPY